MGDARNEAGNGAPLAAIRVQNGVSVDDEGLPMISPKLQGNRGYSRLGGGEMVGQIVCGLPGIFARSSVNRGPIIVCPD